MHFSFASSSISLNEKNFEQWETRFMPRKWRIKSRKRFTQRFDECGASPRVHVGHFSQNSLWNFQEWKLLPIIQPSQQKFNSSPTFSGPHGCFDLVSIFADGSLKVFFFFKRYWYFVLCLMVGRFMFSPPGARSWKLGFGERRSNCSAISQDYVIRTAGRLQMKGRWKTSSYKFQRRSIRPCNHPPIVCGRQCERTYSHGEE